MSLEGVPPPGCTILSAIHSTRHMVLSQVFFPVFFFFHFISFGITTDMGDTLRSICHVMNVSLCYHLHFLAFQFL